jgi:hypothetical protein
LPINIKYSLNKDKADRSHKRHVKRAYHRADPIAHPDDASDDSSLITVFEDGQFDPADFLSRLPSSTQNFFTSIFAKRDRDRTESDVEDVIDPTEKRTLRDTANEVTLTPGVATLPSFHQYHFELSKYNVYLLSLFTNTNLHVINHESSSLTLKKD